MDSQRALLRCLDHLTITSRGCLRRPASNAYRLQRKRTFYTTRYLQQSSHESTQSADQATLDTLDKATAGIQKPSQTPSEPSQPASTTQPASTQPSPRPAPTNTKPGTAHKQPPVDISVLANLDRLIKEKTGPSRSNYNSNTYGRDSTVFKRARTPTKPGPTGSLNVAELVGRRLAADPVGMADLAPEEKRLRLKPTLGRTVDVDSDRNLDVTKAFVKLELTLNGRGNSVKRDWYGQMFHTRKGRAKKEKRRAKWRILFKKGFVAECDRIRKMVKQGW